MSDERRERANHLLMAALDDELSPAEQVEWDRMLGNDPSLRAEWRRLNEVQEVTKTMGYREPPEEVWDTYWDTDYKRFERGAGWILVSIGAAVLFGYGLWRWVERLFVDNDLPFAIRLSMLALLIGGLILLLSVLREKLFTRRHDAYKEIQR
jgi:ferric-dicitrate binding protein FerR (iron transport regulator)